MSQNYSNIVAGEDGCYKSLYERYRDLYREAISQSGSDKFAALVDGSITEVTAEDLASATRIRDSYAFLGLTNLVSITIPGHIPSIPNNTFQDCTNLQTVEILNGVQSIGARCFLRCYKLTTVTIPDSITTIGDNAFQNTSLVKIILPNSIQRIPQAAFYMCGGLQSIDISATVTTIGAEAWSGCSSLTEIICRATTPPSLEGSTEQFIFNNIPDSLTIYVPETAIDNYKTAYGWRVRAASIQSMEN